MPAWIQRIRAKWRDRRSSPLPPSSSSSSFPTLSLPSPPLVPETAHSPSPPYSPSITAAESIIDARSEDIPDTPSENSLEASANSSSIRDYRGRRIFTIYPDEQGANRDPPLEVEFQRSFTGPLAIPDSLANQKCLTFGVQGLLNELNDIMATSYPLSPSLELNLQRCINLDYDFGLAYSFLRPHWIYPRGDDSGNWSPDFDALAERMDKAQSDDATMRRNALDPSKKFIPNPELPPRRVWDLYSNRVIPYYWWGGDLLYCLPVSHSWVAEVERSAISTPINGYEWPVPVPKDSSLERVRIELLNHASTSSGQEYSWLDVLCLQQEGDRANEARCLEEWVTDVPTIGNVYRSVFHALVYFNGLGRPFRNGGYDDIRHWFSRTWTVQEAVNLPFLGGATPSSPDLQEQPQLGFEDFGDHFTSSFRMLGLYFSQYVVLMRTRHATKELDRVSGLASVSHPRYLPIYDPNQSQGEAWAILVKAIGRESRAHLLFWYPVAGEAGSSWVPSWLQVMAHDVPAADNDLKGSSKINYDEARDEFHGSGLQVINNCSVLGLNSPSLETSSGASGVRTGSVTFGSESTGGLRQYSVVAPHQVAIDETVRYTVIFPRHFSSDRGSKRLVVGVRNDAGAFQKLCVLDLMSQESADEVKNTTSFEFDLLLI